MPKIEGGGSLNILKPEKLGLKVGARVHMVVTAPHVVGGKDNLPSLPVEMMLPDGREEKGNFPLNNTRKGQYISVWGDNSDAWIGGESEAIVIPQNNPQTKTQVLAWSLDTDSIKPIGKRGK